MRVPLLLHRVGLGVVDPADDLDAARRAARPPGPCPATRPARRSTRTAQPVVSRSDVGLRSWAARCGRHHLQRVEAGAVVDVDEGEPGLGVAAGAHPALDGDVLADRHLAPARTSTILRVSSMVEGCITAAAAATR